MAQPVKAENAGVRTEGIFLGREPERKTETRRGRDKLRSPLFCKAHRLR